MSKLRMNLEELVVDSFQTGEARERQGTVLGNSVADTTVCPTSYFDTCGNRTFDPGVNTCADSCVNQLNRTACGANGCSQRCTQIC
jgi:hypothetical protein